MKPIVTLTLNPTIDGSASAEAIRRLRKIRTTGERYQLGGGGINVARVIHEFGGSALALYLVGGPTGKIFADLLITAGIKAQRISIEGTTRAAVLSPGADICRSEDVARLYAALRELARPAQ